MKKYKYVIIGGGMTADSAVKGIREADGEGDIALFSNESYKPYNRPPLTKDLWKGKELEKIFRGTENTKSEVFLETTITGIDPAKKTVGDDKGNNYEYEKLLIATGGEPVRLPFGEDNILYYRKLRDYETLRAQTNSKKNFTVIGGGFIGTEIAAGLAMNGMNVTMVFPEKVIGDRVYSRDLAFYITDYYRDKGVTIEKEQSVTAFEKKNSSYVLGTGNGKKITADYVVAGIGIKPSVSLAQSAGINVDNGITVDENLMTNVKDIYAAGDVANFYNPALDKRIRVEHADNANKMGKAAGLSMAGNGEPYHYLPYFYSDMFEMGYEAIGELNSAYHVYADWQSQYKKGVIYYLFRGRVRGVLLWDVWGKVNDARELIASKMDIKRPEDLKDRISF